MQNHPPLVIAITARALFDMEDSHDLFEREGDVRRWIDVR